MKYINYVIEKIPELLAIIPRELWLMIDDFKKKDFKKRKEEILIYRGVYTRAEGLQIFKVGSPKPFIQFNTTEFEFSHRRDNSSPQIVWGINYSTQKKLQSISYNMYGYCAVIYTLTICNSGNELVSIRYI